MSCTILWPALSFIITSAFGPFGTWLQGSHISARLCHTFQLFGFVMRLRKAHFEWNPNDILVQAPTLLHHFNVIFGNSVLRLDCNYETIP